MKLFDSHCHLDDKSYNKDRAQIIENANNNDVSGMMIVGVDITTSLNAIQIASAHENIFTSVGIHPHDAKNCSAKDIETLSRLAKENPCVKAWGETGLDFNRMFSPQKDQENCLISQLEAAGELELPLIFHERDSNGRFFDILKAHGPDSRKGVIHCFSGTKEELIKYLDLGYHIGITGILTIQKRGQALRDMISTIPDNRILIETDAPYLTPAPQKNKYRRNEPAFVKSVLLKLAQIKETDPDTLSEIIFKNTEQLYEL